MSIHQHFRRDEHPFVDQVLDWCQFVQNTFSYRRSDFLDPRQQEIVALLAKYHGEVNASFFGGTSDAERKRAILAPPFFHFEDDDYNLVCFELNYAEKFFTISHRQLLGALMNLGIRRDKLGDLFISGKRVQFVAAREIGDYLALNLNEVGRAAVSLKEIPFTELVVPDVEWRPFSGTVSSLRLDVFISEAFQLSRAKAAANIQAGNVKVNWKTIERPSYECELLDIISVRGHGRCKLTAVDGRTKKGKWRIRYGKK